MRCTVLPARAHAVASGGRRLAGKVRRRYADQYLTPGQGSRRAGVPAVGEVQVGGQLPDAGPR